MYPMYGNRWMLTLTYPNRTVIKQYRWKWQAKRDAQKIARNNFGIILNVTYRKEYVITHWWYI